MTALAQNTGAVQSIRILPEILSNKIAAGEVVERPASVVKELIENSLDAGGSRIIIEIENGGRSLIRITDNGSGMNRDDALLSVERYATSKIYSDEDLFHIRTLGFRGEALPSIASVSRFTLEARDQYSDTGTRIEMDGGKIRNVSEAGMPRGVMISVRRLFFNTPARRKFLKTVQTEMGHIGDTVAAMALARPQVQFHLIHNQKPVKIWTAASDPVHRAADILGGRSPSDFLEIDAAEEGVRLKGWAAVPRLNRKTPQGIYVFVNGRYVKDRVVRHALIEGYSGRIMKGCFPMAVLFIDAPHDRVDVNVHPAKAEVRFLDQSRIHALIRNTVAGALKKADRPIQPENRPELADPRQILEREAGFYRDSRPENRPSEENDSSANPPPAPSIPEHSADYNGIAPPIQPPETHTARQPAPDSPSPPKNLPTPAPETSQTPLFQTMAFGDLRVIGSVHDTYILCESARGLILIDQHAAHERIIYEELKSKSGKGSIQAQLLMIPETIELGFKESAVLDGLIPEFARTGIDIEHFGGNTYAIKSAPVFLNGGEIGPVIIEIIEELISLGIDSGSGIEKNIDEYQKLMACHSSIRAGLRLTNIQIESILHKLDQCDNPSFCPHGRPVWIEWSAPFLEKSFKRAP